MKTALIVAVCAALIVGAAYSWRRLVRAGVRPQSTTPVFTQPETRSVDATVTATGTIRLRTGAEVRVGSELTGIVARLNVTVGSQVQKDAEIAVIESRGLAARITQAKAQIEVDQASLHKLELQLDRIRQMRGLVPRQQEEDLTEDVKNAQARLEKSRSDLTVVESDVPYLTVRAPITGTVSSISTQRGETVAALTGTPIVTLIEDNALELVAMVDETDIAGVRPSNLAVFTTETYPSREFKGVVERIAPKATIVSGVVNYEVGIAVRDGGLLKPDMTANVNIRTAHRSVLTLASGAVHKNGDHPFVYVMRSGTPVKREIAIGQRNAGWTEVKSGVSEGDQILMGKE